MKRATAGTGNRQGGGHLREVQSRDPVEWHDRKQGGLYLVEACGSALFPLHAPDAAHTNVGLLTQSIGG